MKREVALYYPLADLSGVAPFQVEVEDRKSSLLEWLTQLVHTLAIPPSPMALAIFPEGVAPRAAFREKGILYVDFPVEPMFTVTSGVDFERLALEAMVKSFVTQVSDVKGLKLLGNGVDRELFWGHIDIRQPLTVHSERW